MFLPGIHISLQLISRKFFAEEERNVGTVKRMDSIVAIAIKSCLPSSECAFVLAESGQVCLVNCNQGNCREWQPAPLLSASALCSAC